MRVNVATLCWEDLKKHLYTTGGSLPDIFVLDASRADWKRWTDLVNGKYRVLFRDENEHEHEKIDYTALAKYWDSNYKGELPFASVFVGNIRINCFFNCDDVINNDIDPREITSLEDHLLLMEYLTGIAKLLSKQVVLVEEGTRLSAANEWEEEPMLIVDQDQVHIHAYWLKKGR